jgi:hypothetical protein
MTALIRYTCEWEGATTGSCGLPAQYAGPHGKKLCKMHGDHLRKRFGEQSASPLQMTTPKLTDMTPEQMRVACAEELGWSRIDRKPECVSKVAGFKSWLNATWDIGGTPPADKGKPEDDQSYEQIPNFLTDLNAAITLCDEMARRGWTWEAYQTSPSVGSTVCFYKRTNCHRRLAETLPLAIVGAFLLACGRAKP